MRQVTVMCETCAEGIVVQMREHSEAGGGDVRQASADNLSQVIVNMNGFVLCTGCNASYKSGARLDIME